MKKTNTTNAASTAQVKADKARIDQLKELLRSTPQDLDFERVRIMAEVYEDTTGDNQILRRAKFMATLLERKKLYIDDNLFVGAMAGKRNGVYTYPEWQVDWMKEEKTIEKSPTPEDKKANEWALEYWGKRAPHHRRDPDDVPQLPVLPQRARALQGHRERLRGARQGTRGLPGGRRARAARDHRPRVRHRR